MKRHQPLHLYFDDTVYFLTSHTYRNKRILGTDLSKTLLLNKIRFGIDEFGYTLYAWVILDNHYHILLKTLSGDDLPKVISRIHAGLSYELNNIENMRGRKIWQNYWDRCIRSKSDFYKYFNYIHHNPIKHGIVSETAGYKYSSYNYWVSRKEKEWMTGALGDYPIVDFTPTGGD